MSDGNRNTTERPPQRHGLQPAIEYMMSNKIDALLWLTRLGTVVFTIFSITSLFGFSLFLGYQRALLCNAAASALRLHQRLPRVQFTTEFGAMLIMEDSCHYLLYSLLFLYSYPVPMALLPIFLYAVLHSVTYSINILNKLGYADSSMRGILQYLAENHQRNILRFIALSEVCLFPFTVLMMFVRGAFLTPFAYYRFLTFRYASRRNPYTRTVFLELRLFVENFAAAPGRSEVLRNMCIKLVSAVSWLAPPIPASQ